MKSSNNVVVMDATSRKCLGEALVEGRDLAKQLYTILVNDPSSTTKDSPRLKVARLIVATFETSLTLLGGAVAHDSPTSSCNGSPVISPDSDGDLKDSYDESRKRKVVPPQTMKVQGCSESGLEGPVDDGFSWRKYGQKDILGTKYPRAYYRCTHRSDGCLATKQVQRSDDDPTYFEVTYRGKHSCHDKPSAISISMPFYPEPEPGSREVFWSFENPVSTSNSTSNNSNKTTTKNNNNQNQIRPPCLPSFPTHVAGIQQPSVIRHQDDKDSNFVDQQGQISSSPRIIKSNSFSGCSNPDDGSKQVETSSAVNPLRPTPLRPAPMLRIFI